MLSRAPLLGRFPTSPHHRSSRRMAGARSYGSKVETESAANPFDAAPHDLGPGLRRDERRGSACSNAALVRLGLRMAQDRRGVAAVEFAFIAPLMILLYMGLAQLSSAIIASRHTNHSTSSLGDLAAQCSNINDSDIANMFVASSDIMAPLPVSTTVLNQRVSSVMVTDNNGTTQVQWSSVPTGQTAMAAYSQNTKVTLPANLVSAKNDSVIMAETIYKCSFPPNFSINFSDTSYFKPRKSAQVVYASTGTSCYAS